MSDEVIRGRVEADVSGYKRGMDEAARSTEDFRKTAEATARGGLTTLQAVMGSLGRALPLVSGGMAGVALATVGLAKAAAGTAAEIGRAADAVGVSAEEMSRYRYAARVVGVENSAMEGGLRSLRVAIETDSAALRAMGVATRDAAGAQRPLREVLGEVAERFALYEGGTAQAKLGTEVFGDSWKTLQPLIEKGRGGLAELTDEASTFGTVGDDEATAAAQAFEEDVRRLQAALPGLAQKLAGPVVSALGEVIEEFNAARRAGLSFIEMMGGTIFNEMADPTKSLQDRIGERKQDLRRLERGNWFELSWGERLNPFHSEDQLRKEVAWLEQLETIQARAAAAAEQRGAAAQAAGRAAADGALAAMTAEERPDAACGKPVRRTGARVRAAAEPLADEARAYASAMQMLAQAQQDAQMQGLGLTNTQGALLRVMSAPEWAQMPETWRAQVAAQGEAAIAAEEAAAAQSRLNALLGTDALVRQRADMQLLAQAYEQGVVSADEYAEAVQRALGTVPDAVDETAAQFADLQRASEGWGRDSASAIVDFAVTGKASFSEMVDSMLADLARMVVHQQVTGPLATAIGAVDWAGMFGFADGGVMTGRGPAPLRAYAGGGVASSPQVAVFGEGAMPEAYVPLPDGRTIPVTIAGDAGQGGVRNVRVEIRNEGAQKVVAQAEPRFDVDGLVVSVVLRDLRNNGPIRQALGR